MGNISRWIAGFVCVALVSHFAFVLIYPYAMIALLEMHLSHKVGTNQLVHARRPNSDSRDVIRPSPDLFYSIGCFDLRSGPLELTAAVPHSYMSLSLYAANGDNFFVINDQQVTHGVLRVVVRRDHGKPAPADALEVQAPCRRGIMLFRYFAGDTQQQAEIDLLRRQTQCRVAAD